MSGVTGLPAFPAPRTDPLAPPPEYLRWQRDEPLTRVTLWTGQDAWLATRWADVRTVLQDRRFSADVRRPGFPLQSAAQAQALAQRDPVFIRMDAPEHTRQRRMLTGEFLVRRAEAMRPRIAEIVDGFLDALVAAGPPADLVEGFALPVPSLVICLLLGVPYADHDFFQRCSRALLDRRRPAAELIAASDELRGYLGDLVEHRRREPADDLISRLVGEREARGELTRDQVVSMALLLLVAGHETTANMISLGTLALLRDPAQWAALRADPGLVPGAVEELLRYLSIVHQGVPRLALEDVRFGEVTVRAGEPVLAVLPAANHDPDVFGEPDRLDVHRAAHRHVAFGYGVHQCLGQPLARVELQVALTRLTARLPGLTVVDAEADLRFRHDGAVYGVERLAVAW